MTRFLLICAGGAIGTGARYILSLWAVRAMGTGFPFGTLLVNFIGSFLLGAVLQLSLTSDAIGPDGRLILGVGVLGGFTTYSTFNYETLELLRAGSWTLAAANLLVTIIGCLVAGMLGVAAARLVAP